MNTVADNQISLRHALGCFATGVAVITTVSHDGRKIGITANSFSSVSLDPPLVLWSLNLRSPNVLAFKHASHFAINVLAYDQRHLSEHFSNRMIVDKFSGVDVDTGLGGIPLVRDALARFECASELARSHGDHELFIGRVVRYARSETAKRQPLIFCRGDYFKCDVLAST